MVDTQLDARYSNPGATAVPWARAEERLRAAGGFWISTVRPDGRPHMTPLIAVWLDGSLYFSTGPAERKARNLAANPHCVLTTGSDAWDEGFDVIVEGDAVRVTDEARLRRIADAYVAKYGSAWRFGVRDGAFRHDPESLRGDDPGEAWVYEVAPVTAFGFGKGEFTQTRWRFPRG
jgi:nitroimidazol reductase NimA-like FMN-containing flavoprotein (pyridoxamine 5'-phosphate oxidase superfamily)